MKPVTTPEIEYLNGVLSDTGVIDDPQVLSDITLYLQTSCTSETISKYGIPQYQPKYPGRKAKAYMKYYDTGFPGKHRTRLAVLLDSSEVVDIGLHGFKKFLR